MIIKLKEVMEKMGKSILDVARETGLNRNAVSALYHNRVDGIKFPTIEILCSTYKLQISDLIELASNKVEANSEKQSLYLQEGEIVMFTTWPWVARGGDISSKYFDVNFKELDVYFVKDYGYCYWRTEYMNDLAQHAYDRYNNPEKLNKLYSTYEIIAKEIETLYFANSESDILNMSKVELLHFFAILQDKYKNFWDISLFIDAFDAGFDQKNIKQIAKQYDLSIDEISILTSPTELTYNNERILDLIRLSHNCKNIKNISDYVANSIEVKKYIKNYDYYKSNYAFIEHIQNNEIIEGINYYLQDKNAAAEKLSELSNFTKNQKQKISAVLKKHKLKENPLHFFNQLTFWREHRKKVNLMGIHLLFYILKRIEVETGISGKHLKCLSFDEVSNVFNGLIGETELKNRYEKGVMISVKNGGYKLLLAEEAASLRQDLEKLLEKNSKIEELYRQEGDLILFMLWPPFFIWNNPDARFLSGSMGQYEAFFKNGYAWGYFRKEKMKLFAERIYEKYADMKKFDKFYAAYMQAASDLEKFFLQNNKEDVTALNRKDLMIFIQKLSGLYKNFWSLSLFIDTFDGGFDQEEIARIAKKHNFSSKEIAVLTTPSKNTFSNERLLTLLELANELSKTNLDKHDLRKFIETSPRIADYIRKFEYYKSNYAHIETITHDEIEIELTKYLRDMNLLTSELGSLKNYERESLRAKNEILHRHGLSQNPLEFFARLSYWREHRKKINLMGIHLLFYIMMAVERMTNIPVEYLKNSTQDEVEDILNGKIDAKILKKRGVEGFLFMVDEKGYKVVYGKEANDLHEQIEKQFVDSAKEEIIKGFVASQGYARGIARVIQSKSEFDKFQEGEILITGMTRPEFVPLMKKAAGIVTNEGGITCHAAIVSRELNKPCIIGTQIATQVIRDGDLIEVRANHGTVRIVKRKR